MPTTQEVLEVLGGDTVVGAVHGSLDFAMKVRSGLPFQSFNELTLALAISQGELAKTLSIQPRTLTRRKAEGRLEAEESDRLFRLARIFAYAISVFGSEEKAAAWMERENRALGGLCPRRLLDTDIGAREVENALGRIEHGIFA
jgi:putative toxin-antitoxin system antitoxin component (TIGR02293 family)